MIPANDVSVSTKLTRNSILRDLSDAVTGALYTKLSARHRYELASEEADIDATYAAWIEARDRYVAALEAHFAAVQAVVSGDLGEQLEAMRPWVEARLAARKAGRP